VRGRKEIMKTGSRFAHISEKGSGKFMGSIFLTALPSCTLEYAPD